MLKANSQRAEQSGRRQSILRRFLSLSPSRVKRTNWVKKTKSALNGMIISHFSLGGICHSIGFLALLLPLQKFWSKPKASYPNFKLILD